jgi:hypothetical protein
MKVEDFDPEKYKLPKLSRVVVFGRLQWGLLATCLPKEPFGNREIFVRGRSCLLFRVKSDA